MPPRSIVILTGAGISAESGIKTFRDQNGLWENYPVEDVASLDGFERNPTLVQEFYNQRRAELSNPAVRPNAAHLALARLEREWKSEFLLVTQNIDNLHERAGSNQVLHMHGELQKARCLHSGRVSDCTGPITAETRCPCCGKSNALRPHIVWFGEVPLHMDTILEVLARCDLFLAIGTSGQVYPAAGFVHEARRARKIEINLDPSAMSSSFDDHRLGRATEMVPTLVEELLTAPVE